MDGGIDKSTYDRGINALLSLSYAFTENPFIQGMGDLSDLGRGKKQVLDFILETAKGVFMPNMLLTFGGIADPYYYMTQSYNGYKNGFEGAFNPERYAWYRDPNILWGKIEKSLIPGLTGDRTAIYEGMKSTANLKRNEMAAKLVED